MSVEVVIEQRPSEVFSGIVVKGAKLRVSAGLLVDYFDWK